MGKLLLVFICISFLASSPLYGQFPEPAKEEGFERILTDKTFSNWDGDTRYWRLEDGVLIGETTESNPLDENTFLIWKEDVDDFELKVEMQISAEGNSGINYRSQKVNGIPHALQGYQADFDAANKWSGQAYEERGRRFLALRGQLTEIGKDDVPKEVGSIGEDGELASVINPQEWNELHLIVRGNTLIHLLNGQVMSVVFDDGEQKESKGFLGLQLHTGPPMKVKFRNLKLKQL